MTRNFTTQIRYDGKTVFAAIISEVRNDGRYYEVNIKGFPRFYMRWSELERYDVVTEGLNLPYNLVLAVSDALEEKEKKK